MKRARRRGVTYWSELGRSPDASVDLGGASPSPVEEEARQPIQRKTHAASLTEGRGEGARMEKGILSRSTPPRDRVGPCRPLELNWPSSRPDNDLLVFFWAG